MPESEFPVAFVTGVSVIDEQHRVLIRMLDEIVTTLDDAGPLAEYERMVLGLIDYAGEHFRTEEGLMAEHGFDRQRAADAESHVRLHRAFTARVNLIAAGIKDGKRLPKADLERFVFDWLTDHIMQTDMVLAAFLRGR